MNFFKKDLDIDDYKLNDLILSEFEFPYEIFNLYTKISPNGGPLLCTTDMF